MAHLSENSNKLKINYIGKSIQDIDYNNNIWLLTLPFVNSEHQIDTLNSDLKYFFENTYENTTVILLTSPYYAANILTNKNIEDFYLKLWIGIDTSDLEQKDGTLLQKHSALLVLSNNKEPIKHTKTRIGYTFCPHCDKTTKDYGGKKHLYHSFGTLMSDVWKDFKFEYNGNLDTLINRIQDLFGIPEFNVLNYVDLRDKYSLNISDNKKNDFNDVIVNNSIKNSFLLNGDCINELKNIPDNSIDFCFVDPPYNIKKKYESWDDSIDLNEYFEWCNNWLSELARIIKPGCTVAVLNIPQWAIKHFEHLNSILDFQDWIIWDAMGLPVRMIMPSHYSILCFSKGKPRPLPGLNRLSKNQNTLFDNNLYSLKKDYCVRASCIKSRTKNNVNDKEIISNIWSDIHRLKHNSKRVDHPTQLPPVLMKRLITLFTNENEIVLDCFNGSGTTTLCAELVNRKYIGIELSDYYYNIAVERHVEISKGMDPFRKNDDIPKTKNNDISRTIKQKYEVDKKTLQLEVKEISNILNKIPNRDEVKKFTKYKIEYFDNYFSNWSEVTAAARTTGMAEVENKIDYIKNIKDK